MSKLTSAGKTRLFGNSTYWKRIYWMSNQIKLSPYTGSKKVFADIFSWVAAAENHPSIPMEGLYRHAEAIARRYTPAVMLAESEMIQSDDVARLEQYLGKKIHIFTSVQQLIDVGGDVWMSIAVDAPSPRLPEMKDKILRVAILHDILALHGVFGIENERTFNFGAQHNDIFLPVSQTTEDLFVAYYRKEFSKYPDCRWYSGFHCYDESILNWSRRPRVGNYALGVGTIYTRKNTFANTSFSVARLALPYSHVGMMRDESSYVEFLDAIYQDEMKFYGFLPDFLVEALWKNADAYINLSSAEGFSLGPLEAILWRVPQIILSDIQVHRELYEYAQTTFVGMDEITRFLNGRKHDWDKIDVQEYSPNEIDISQKDYFHRYAVETVFNKMEQEIL